MHPRTKGIVAAVAGIVMIGGVVSSSLLSSTNETMEQSIQHRSAVSAPTQYSPEPVATNYEAPDAATTTIVTVAVHPDETFSAYIERETDVSQSTEHPLQSITVYVSSAGKYHRHSDCSGMKNSTAMDMDDAIYEGYIPCRKCYTTVYPESFEQAEIELPVGEDVVYVSSTGKYHVRSDCSGMKQSTAMTREQADAAGHVPCKKCY